jgi:hypothetical protein
MAYYVQLQFALFVTLLLLFGSSLVLAEPEGNETATYLDKRSSWTEEACALKNMGSQETDWTWSLAICLPVDPTGITSYGVNCINLLNRDPLSTGIYMKRDCPPNFICENIQSPSKYPPDKNQLAPDIICKPKKFTEHFKTRGQIGDIACSSSITAAVGLGLSMTTEFARLGPSRPGFSWNSWPRLKRDEAFVAVNMAYVQSNLIGGRPVPWWITRFSKADTVDFKWTHLFSEGEEIRVCFVSGVKGVVQGTLYQS